MHQALLDLNVARIRQRISEGDCKFTDPVSTESMEWIIAQQADELEKLKSKSAGQIKIQWTSDVSDCEDCGSSYAEGAKVFINDELALDLEPFASCFDSVTYDISDIFVKILEHLGYSIDDDYNATS